jgi:hypothetical protein
MRVFQLRFELIDAIFLQPQLALEQFARGVVLSTTRGQRGDEKAAQNQRTAEFHFGRSTSGDELPRRIRRNGCGMVAVLPTYVNGSLFDRVVRVRSVRLPAGNDVG